MAILGAVLIATLLAAFPAAASAQQGDPEDLTTVSLESLMQVQVSSVARHREELRKAAAAVYVITQSDIRRSGVTDVAELLRMVPGVDVARVNSSTWAVSVRGFNAQYANKLLVIVDGRTAYDPTFSGVFWNLQNLVLEDIDRIEVIRGPGATMWGANAVNGVISITTKPAAETQGGLLTADSGSGRPAEGSGRFGGSIGKNAFYRVFGRQTTRLSLDTPAGTDGGDSWNLTNAGFRLDWNVSKKDSFTFQSDLYRGVNGDPRNILTSLSPIIFASSGLQSDSGGNALVRWKHLLKDDSSLTLQAYFDSRHRSGYDNHRVNVADFDLQHNFKIGARHTVVWGVGHRESSDRFEDTLGFGLNPASKKMTLSSALVQDEIAIAPGKLYLTLGSKLERSSFAGFNAQPTARLSWQPTLRQSAWIGASRAFHTPSRVERGLHLTIGTFAAGPSIGLVNLTGQAGTQSEAVMAYEAGYRYQANQRFWMDTAVSYNGYNHLSTQQPGAPFFQAQPAPPHLVQPIYFANNVRGETYGIETAANYRVNGFLTLRSSYSFLRMQLHGPPGDLSAQENEGHSPRHKAYLAAFLNLPRSFELSGHTYFVSRLPSYRVPGYTRVDLNLAWNGLENVEFSVAGQNLLGPHLEFGNVPTPSNLVNRSIYGKVTWKF